MTSFSGSSTAVARGARSFRSSRRQSSRIVMSIHESAFDTPMRSAKSRIASGVKPRRRKPTIVGMRGSSQPSTCFSSTSWISLRLLIARRRCRLSRANSICCGSGRASRPKSASRSLHPVVERAVVLELERADRVGDVLQRVRDAVGVVVHRVDAPLVAGAVVVRVADAVDDRVAQVDVRRVHVDLQPQHARAVGELAGAHAAEQVEVLRRRAVAIGAVLGRARSACRGSARISSAVRSST